MSATRHAGFTLIEVLVALSVLGLVLVLLSQGVQFGLRATQLQTELRDRRSDLESVDRALRRMVALADPGIYPEPPSLRGRAHTLSFTTELPAGAGPRQRADVALSAETGRLVLRWMPHLHIEPFGPAPAWRETVLLDGVEQVEFAYRAAASGAWSPTWRADRLPSLVRIRIVFPERSGRRWPPIIAALGREASEE